jgi:hypothetical protein
MNPNELIRWAARSAVWQLARRSPTWLLIVIVLGALAYGSGKSHGDALPTAAGLHFARQAQRP